MDYSNIFSEFYTLDSLNEAKKRIDESFKNRRDVIGLACKADSLKSKSLWFIKESFEAIAPELYGTESGRVLLTGYINAIKSDKAYQRAYSLYESVRKTGKNSDVDYFVTETANHDWKLTRKKLNEMKDKLGALLSLAYIYVGSEKCDSLLSEDNKKLDRALMFIAESNKNHKNISEFGQAVKVIREFVENNDVPENVESSDIDSLASDMIDEFNKKYSDLDEEESELIREMAKTGDSERIFEKYKKICSNKLDEQKRNFAKNGDDESASRLSEMKDRVSKKVFNDETAHEDIVNLIEMTKMLG